MNFSDDINKILNERFNLSPEDLKNLSLEELKNLKESIVELRQEYFLLEMSQKTLGNAAYGAAANQYFYFFNVALAGDITGECRNLTKTMWKNLEDWFHEGIWKRRDLWERFDFELDESKHDWYRKQAVSIYSDTDSCPKNSLLLIKDNKNIEDKITIGDLFNESYDKFGLEDITQNNQEIVKSDKYVLNWTRENGLQYVPIKYIMRHRVSKSRFKIKTKSGKEIIVTGDHSCIVFRNGKQLVIKAKDIDKSTDKILSIVNNEE